MMREGVVASGYGRNAPGQSSRKVGKARGWYVNSLHDWHVKLEYA